MTSEQLLFILHGAVYFLTYIITLAIGMIVLSDKKRRLRYNASMFLPDEYEKESQKYRIAMLLLLIPVVQVIFLFCWFFFVLGKYLRTGIGEYFDEIRQIFNKR